MDFREFNAVHTGVCDLPRISVGVVGDLSQLTEVIMIRSTVWMLRDGARHAAHFDAADLQSSNLLGRVNGEPAGTMRIRWFADFARFERFAVRPQYHSVSLLFAMADTAIELCRTKGYRTIISLAEQRGRRFWERRGAVVCGEPVEACGVKTWPMRMALLPGAHPAIAAGPAAAGTPDFEKAVTLSDTDLLSDKCQLEDAA